MGVHIVTLYNRPLPVLSPTLPYLTFAPFHNSLQPNNTTQHNTTHYNLSQCDKVMHSSLPPLSLPPFSLICLGIALMTHHIRSLWSLFYYPLSLSSLSLSSLHSSTSSLSHSPIPHTAHNILIKQTVRGRTFLFRFRCVLIIEKKNI